MLKDNSKKYTFINSPICKSKITSYQPVDITKYTVAVHCAIKLIIGHSNISVSAKI